MVGFAAGLVLFVPVSLGGARQRLSSHRWVYHGGEFSGFIQWPASGGDDHCDLDQCHRL